MTTEQVVPSAAARRLFESAVVIDGLDTSNWGAEQHISRAARRRCYGLQRHLSDLAQLPADPGQPDHMAALVRRVLRDTSGRCTRWPTFTPRRPKDAPASFWAGRTRRRWKATFDASASFTPWACAIVQLTYNERNLFGNGCWERTDEGLSVLGLAAIREMNKLGILIDLSHVGDRTVLDTIEHSEQPVVFHPRQRTVPDRLSAQQDR